MKKLWIAMCCLFLFCACRRKCDCSVNQTCFDNQCSCAEWTEGAGCTPMRDKFIGKYVGTITINGGTPTPDTAVFFGEGIPIKYLFTRSLNPQLPARSYGIRIEKTRTGVFFADYLQPNLPNSYLDNFNPIDCGYVRLSEDNNTLSITWHPLIDSVLIDFSHTYEFTGLRQ